MERVECGEPPTQYYIPHHGILRPDKLTTKLRVVFNASSPTTTGASLNDILMKGDVKDVFETITQFRRHQFTFTTDIQKNVQAYPHRTCSDKPLAFCVE
ncbi:DUF1758 domain-containing protein [Trichonephila clavipes]|nr:DUF1758 domain-containing protein [Trichonephila clavipes]